MLALVFLHYVLSQFLHYAIERYLVLIKHSVCIFSSQQIKRQDYKIIDNKGDTTKEQVWVSCRLSIKLLR